MLLNILYANSGLLELHDGVVDEVDALLLDTVHGSHILALGATFHRILQVLLCLEGAMEHSLKRDAHLDAQL